MVTRGCHTKFQPYVFGARNPEKSMIPTQKKLDTFPLFVFSMALIGGVVLGAMLGAHVVEDSNFAVLLAAVSLPLGVLVGLGFAERIDPISAFIHVISVLDRHTTRTERGFSPTTTELMAAIGPAALAAISGAVIAVILKVEMMSIVVPMTIGGAVYGVVVAGLIVFLAAGDAEA